MIVGSLVLLVASAGLLLSGLILGSDTLVGGSIAASVLASVLLYVRGRRAARGRDREVPETREAEPVGAPGSTGAAPDLRARDAGSGRTADGHAVAQPGTQQPADVWVGGGRDDDDPVDEPAIQRRPSRVAAMVARLDAEVLVVDGRPRYHVAGCGHLAGREAEPLPAYEAVELGFSPCGRCEPDTVLVRGAPATHR